MASTHSKPFRRVGVADSDVAPQFASRWIGRITLIALSVVLLTLSVAPLSLWPLAFVALVPWLIIIRSQSSRLMIFLLSWLTGTLFFAANMAWLWKVTPPGMVALVIYLGSFFGLFAILIRPMLWPRSKALLPSVSPPPSAIREMLAMAVLWTALEWVRGNYSILGNEGLPWLYLGHSQSHFLQICQIADISGVGGITFLILLVNALATRFIAGHLQVRPVAAACVITAGALIAVIAYGHWRMTQRTLTPATSVMLVQSNFPQDNSGAKGATQEQLDRFHINTTIDALKSAQQEHRQVDLVLWSETMMDALNHEARDFIYDISPAKGERIQKTFDALGKLAGDFRVGLLVGGVHMMDWREKSDADGSTFFYAADRRNTAYFFSNSGIFSDDRYDKVKLVPFGEFMPYQHSFPFVYRILMSFNPYTEEYTLTRGDREALTVFELNPMSPATAPATTFALPAANSEFVAASSLAQPATYRFVTPICFEDLESSLVARMFRPDSSGEKRADFMVNLTNDGWFIFQGLNAHPQAAQHLQAAIFRSIENRAPTARSVNTGISAFIDSCGRVYQSLPPGAEGTSIAQLQFDSRVTFFTRFGEVFSQCCVAVSLLWILVALISSRISAMQRRLTDRPANSQAP